MGVWVLIGSEAMVCLIATNWHAIGWISRLQQTQRTLAMIPYHMRAYWTCLKTGEIFCSSQTAENIKYNNLSTMDVYELCMTAVIE